MERITVPGYEPPNKPVKKVRSAKQKKFLKEMYQDRSNQEKIARKIKELQ